MKKFILIFIFLVNAIFGFGQKQTNIWYFGNGVGLDFNQVPVQPLNNGKVNSIEGTSVISDNNGRLLFYTNGFEIMNRQHLVMKNGGALAGNPSSTNNAVIVPLPGSVDSIYYVFTVGAANQAKQQFQYNIVNMKGDGGLGEVEPTGMNITIEDKVFEKLAAVKHCNKKDIWIVVHKWNSDEYHSYLLTKTGLSNTPVISNTGLVTSGEEINALGTLKFSSKGNKLAACHAFVNNVVELMDFDNTTGMLSNSIIIHPDAMTHLPNFVGVYGAEFSPDCKLLYVSAINSDTDPSTLYQFDITSNNAAAILASKQIIAQTTPWLAGGLQLASDQKIYMTMLNDSALSVIENPNLYGPGCNFVYNKIYMGPVGNSPLKFGLPTFMQSYFDTTSNPYDFTRVPGNCLDRNVIFKINRLSGIDSVKWYFGDTQQSQALQPTNNYALPGFYDVQLIVYKVDCSGLNDTITRKIWIADSNDFLGDDTLTCNVSALQIGIEQITGANYLWNTGLTTSKIAIANVGDYWLELEQNGCKLRDTIKVTEKARPVVSLGVDTSICKYKPVVLRTVNSNYESYLWSTGETTPSILVNQTGTYHITVSKNSCTVSDTIKVSTGDCDVYIPNAFTPNNDSRNETFGVVDYAGFQYFLLQVFDKWGKLIFSSSDVTKKWNGTYKAKNMPSGSYVWVLDYRNMRGVKFHEQGTVLLIR